MLSHTLNWYKGEVTEGYFILAFGIILLLISIICGFAQQQSVKALCFPLVVCGMIFMLIGSVMSWQNQQAIVQLLETYQPQNEAQFVLQEQQRVNNFQYLYPLTLLVSFIFFTIALALLQFSQQPIYRAIGVVFVITAMSLNVIDYFSKLRAEQYAQFLQSYQALYKE